MALHFDVSAIENHEALTTEWCRHPEYATEEYLSHEQVLTRLEGDPVKGTRSVEIDGVTYWSHWAVNTDQLVWALAAIGVSEISEKTLDTIFVRALLLGKLERPWQIRVPSGEIVRTEHLPMWVLRQHIGLNTNVSTLTKAAFLKSLYAGAELTASRMRASTEKPKPAAPVRKSKVRVVPASEIDASDLRASAYVDKD